MFWPAFFLPPKDIIEMPYADGAFAWNNGWYAADAPLIPLSPVTSTQAD
jgi:glucan endo-1,3-alpha-glucosidase